MANQSRAVQKGEDGWSTWLLGCRHGHDQAYQQRMLNVVKKYRDRVLEGARLEPGMTLIDVGTGDGLIAFGAIAKAGPSLRVILTDISQPLLNHVEQIATERGIRGQCEFVQGSADKLAGIANSVADVVASARC